MYPDFGKRGLIWVTSDELIHIWESRKVAMNQGARLKQPWKWRHKEGYRPYNWKLRIDTETKKVPKPERKAQSLRETKGIEPLSDAPPASQTPEKSFAARRAEARFLNFLLSQCKHVLIVFKMSGEICTATPWLCLDFKSLKLGAIAVGNVFGGTCKTSTPGLK